MAGRPRLDIGTYGMIHTTRVDAKVYRAHTRFRDQDGRVRKVSATASSANSAIAEPRCRLLERAAAGDLSGRLHPDTPFEELSSQWLSSIQSNPELSVGTKDAYERELCTLLLPTWKEFSVREVTPARVDRFLTAQRAVSYSRAKHSKTLLQKADDLYAPRRS